jgi:cysteine-rich secretory family protein
MRVPGSAHAGLVRDGLAAALLAALALALAPSSAHADAACPGSDLQPDATNIAQTEDATLCMINVALTKNDVLLAAALEHSHDMVDNKFFSHDSSSGDDFEGRIIRFRYAPTNVLWEAGENLAWGTLSLSTPASIVDSWMHSPEHRDNILNPDFKELGVGIVTSTPEGDVNGATYTADFGVKGGHVPRAASKPRSHKHRAKRRHHRGRSHRGRGHRAKRSTCSATRSSAVSFC